MPRWIGLGAGAVLHELSPPLCLTLWQRLLDVELWGQTSPQDHRSLFQEQDRIDRVPAFMWDASPEPRLETPLALLNRMVVHPERVDTAQVVHACRQIADWAAEAGHEATAEYFIEVAALVQPKDPELARLAGRMARRRGDYDRGLRWYRRAVGLAQNAHDPEGQALAYIWWGTLEEQRGEVGRARELYLKGWRTAKRRGLHVVAASAQHDLLALCEFGISLEQGMAHAAAALQGYGAKEPRLPALAHDVAVLWVMHGHFQEAQRLFEAALPHIHARHARIQIVSSIARASAAIRDVERFYSAWDEVTTYTARFTEGAAAALINVARGARTLRRETVAKDLLAQAVQIARGRGEVVVERIAHAVQDSSEPVDEVLPAPPPVTAMLSEVLSRLQRFAAPS